MLIVLGLLVMLTPFSGLPTAFRSLLEVVFGAGVLGIGLMMRSHEAKRVQQAEETHTPEPATPPTMSAI